MTFSNVYFSSQTYISAGNRIIATQKNASGIASECGYRRFSGATAIRSAKANTKQSDTIYSLNGTRRNAMQKGINIVDGKKIIAK